MPRPRKYDVIEIEHADGEVVYCWGREQGVETVGICLRAHPSEPVTVRAIKMTEEEYDEMPDYTGEC